MSTHAPQVDPELLDPDLAITTKNSYNISMDMTRRDFISTSLMAGGTLLIFPACSPGQAPAAPGAQPAASRLIADGQLLDRVDQIYALMDECTLCPRLCKVNRSKGETGYCRAPREPIVASHQPHFGEELPLVGQHGSGTIFFSNCNLRCVFCQNWPIAHSGRGQRTTDRRVAEMMLHLQRRRCHNINFVTPTHVLPNLLAATEMAYRDGFRLPLVYNTSGYERPEIITMLDGIIDIYMPDIKFMDSKPAGRYLGAADYPDMARGAVREMYRQVGPLQCDERGIATHGLMIRHLVMPNRLSNAKAFVNWVAETLSRDVYVNIMAQYRVEHRAFEYPSIARAISTREFIEAIEWAEDAGLTQLDERSLAQRNRRLRR